MQILLSVLFPVYLDIANAAMLNNVDKVVSQNTWPPKMLVAILSHFKRFHVALYA